MVKQSMAGYNGTVFTYGQSGSGKTYTMDALRKLAMQSFFDYIDNCPAREFLLRISYYELFNEKLTDLLCLGSSSTLTIRKNSDEDVRINGLEEIIVTSEQQAKDVLLQGNARRTVAEIRLPQKSSRAHWIFRLIIESRERDGPENSSVYMSYLNLVDLAGSEKAGEREGVLMNRSLLTLAELIHKLSDGQREINYGDSKLTRILQTALDGNSNTAILCTVTPSSVEETQSTLKFAQSAMKVNTKPQLNEVFTDKSMLKKQLLEMTTLANKIKELERNQVQASDERQRRREEEDFDKKHVLKLENDAAEIADLNHLSRPSPEELQKRQDDLGNVNDNGAEATGSGASSSSAAGGGIDDGSHNRSRISKYGRAYTRGQRLPEELRLEVIKLIEQGTETCVICTKLKVSPSYVCKMRNRLDL